MSNLEKHAQRELEAAGLFDPDSDYNGMIGKAVMELVKVFAAQGHSGMSASFVTDLFHRVSQYQPLGPLTGEEGEWVEVADGLWQNKRCSSVFKDSAGAYDANGQTFLDDGCRYVSSHSRLSVSFPYTPVTIDHDCTAEEWEARKSK